MKPNVTAYFDENTFTVSYLVCEPEGTHCAIIDPVLDFDAKSGRTGTGSADKIIADVRKRGLTVDWILETHAHADHLSAAPYLKRNLGGQVGIGEHIAKVQEIFKEIFHLESTFNTDGAQFDHLIKDDETIMIGTMAVRAIHTPGHTPADMTYVIGDAAFVGDTLFMPDYGTARTDFPGGDAGQLFRSIRRVLELPPATRIFLCHDYKAPGRDEYRWETTVEEERAHNIHVRDGVTEEEFVAMRTARDETLSMPALLLPSVQVNVRAGEMPPPEENGVRYLKIPLDRM